MHRCWFSLLLGALHQSEREEERVSKHHESGSSAEGILLYILNQQHLHTDISITLHIWGFSMLHQILQWTELDLTPRLYYWCCVCLVALRTDLYWLSKAISPSLHNVWYFLFFSSFFLVLFQLIILRILHCLRIKPIKPLCSHRLATYFSHFLYTPFVSSRVNAHTITLHEPEKMSGSSLIYLKERKL